MLYNEYRPRRWREIVGQDAIVNILRSQVRAGRVAHSYLLGGPSGVGKTSMARILAAAVNCGNARAGEPCGRCVECNAVQSGHSWDVVELDAASQRGIDEVRGLQYKAALAPLGNRKVYVLDEAHQLTGPAWQSLQKILEEPPPALLWVLCTTAPTSVPETVRSRCQVFSFQPVALNPAVEYLARVAKAQRANVDLAGLRFLARSSNGNLRDALTGLEQVLCQGRRATSKRVKQVVQATRLAI